MYTLFIQIINITANSALSVCHMSLEALLYCRRTARRAMWVEVLSTAARQYMERVAQQIHNKSKYWIELEHKSRRTLSTKQNDPSIVDDFVDKTINLPRSEIFYEVPEFHYNSVWHWICGGRNAKNRLDSSSHFDTIQTCVGRTTDR